MKNKNTLLESYRLTNQLKLKNRIVMAPMTRAQADDDGSPTQAMADYYARRADAGLIITEGTIIHPEATGYHHVPGIYTNKHVEQWKLVSKAVHKNGGRIFMQIWHVGRVSHPSFLNGHLPLSASATTMQGRIRRTQNLYYGQSREATRAEIKLLIQSYADAAKKAINAGMDGVELHAANGYLIDQFLHYHTNLRQDEYGGNAKNMSRFALEIVKACGDAIGYERVGIRLSPGAYLNEIVGDTRDSSVFSYLLSALNNLPIAYVHTGNFDDRVKFKELDNQTMTQFIKFHYDGTVIASGGYDLVEVEKQVDQTDFDLVSIGRAFIANPDLVAKFKQQETLDSYNVSMLETLN
jgi:N-ethylmaleimide reductase